MAYRRKFIDLILGVSSKWANWDPPSPMPFVQVGQYGDVDKKTGELIVAGNIYDPEFQLELDKLGLQFRTADHPPEEGSPEDDAIITSKGAKRLDDEAGVAGTVANASIKGQWQFERGKRDALLIMHRPRLISLPKDVILDTIYRVPKLKDKWLVTSVYLCPAFSMYLSNKSGEKVSLALVAQVPVAGATSITAGADGSFTWHSESSDASAGLLRKACDKTGNYSYSPLYTLKRRAGLFKRWFREEDSEDQLTGDDQWVDAPPPWDPLDEDGDTDSLAAAEEDQPEF